MPLTVSAPAARRAGAGDRAGGIAGSLARLDGSLYGLALRAGAAPGWLGCAELLGEPDRLRGWAEDVRGWLDARYGEAPERAVAGYLLTWYLAVPAQLAAVLFRAERRVPSLRPADLAIRLDADRPRPAAVAVLSAAFACLPGDPEADSPSATVLPDDAALAAVLRGRFVAHAARFVAAFPAALGEGARLGRRTLWAAATDALAEALWYSGRYLGDEGGGVADAGLVLPATRAAFTGGPAGCATAAGGCWTRRRSSCCFHYVLAAGTGPCATCPRLAAGR